MPAVTHAELAVEQPLSTISSYHLFSASHICAGLAILGLLAIFRLVAHAMSKSKSGNGNTSQAHRDGQVDDDLSHLVNQQSLHHHFFHDRIWPMEEKSRGVSSNTATAEDGFSRKTGPFSSLSTENAKDAGARKDNEGRERTPSPGSMFGPGKLSGLTSTRLMMSRPPPPPPLTPPELSPSVFTYDDRRRSFTGFTSELDASFFEQPNPDYMSSTETETETEMATTTATRNVQTTRSSPTPRRRSYTKTLPIGIPATTTGPASDGHGTVFSPSSYPPTSLLLPGPPPIHGEILEDGTFREIKVQGEIISMLDGSGAGWKRHTRVYGGGACLACAASCDDGHHGGFYGENVLPEERRY
ncbi:hypothetical protein CGCVW01_v001996 [Colletotrichum viniferum]|nr:hypothetical protein CGCVW01_v001996 [Colletotrichum viniferum]